MKTKLLAMIFVFLFSTTILMSDVVDKMEYSGWTYYGKWTSVTYYYDLDGDGEADWYYHKTVLHLWGGVRVVWLEGSGACAIQQDGDMEGDNGHFPTGMSSDLEMSNCRAEAFIENPLPQQGVAFDTLYSEYTLVVKDTVNNVIVGEIHKPFGEAYIDWIDLQPSNPTGPKTATTITQKNEVVIKTEESDNIISITNSKSFVNIKVMNIDGQIIKEYNNTSNIININKNDFASGLYFIIGNTQSNNQSLKKFTIIK